MQLGTEIGEMRRNLFTGFSKNRSWMLNTGDAAVIFARVDLVIDKVMVQALKRWRAKPGPKRVVDIIGVLEHVPE